MGIWIVSRCLLGERCRYDGQTKDSPAIRDFLNSKHAEIISICPECDCGMPCPRAPMTLGETGGKLHLTDASGNDHTQQMECWISKRMDELAPLTIQGCILKSRSPSCAYGTVQIDGRERPGNGLFADALRQRFPNLLIQSERNFTGGEAQLSPEKLLDKVQECVRRLLASSPACHDWDHTLRVYKNACTLMERTKAVHDASLPTFNELIVKVASLMHDIGRPKELSDCGKTNHAAYGAALAKEWLRAIGVTDNAFIEAVAACIRSHRFRKRDGNTIPATLEERFVYDADKLDSIGAIGIGRSFHFAGRTGARVHNHEDEALSGKSYGREDSAYREYLVKLKDVRNSMLTQAGRQLALHRHDFMVGFFEELNRECFEDL